MTDKQLMEIIEDAYAEAYDGTVATDDEAVDWMLINRYSSFPQDVKDAVLKAGLNQLISGIEPYRMFERQYPAEKGEA